MESVGASVTLHPVLAELFEGLGALGSTPRHVTELLRAGGVSAGARVLDLACGKGAGAIDAAEALGCSVLGVDACEEFVQAARRAARDAGTRVCRFRVGDVQLARGRFDAAMMIGLFGASEAAALLRERVRPGGVYIFDDAVRNPRHPGAAEYAQVPTLSEVRAMIEQTGDRVLRARLIPAPEVRALAARSVRTLTQNAATIMRDRPRHKRELHGFLADQRHSAQLLQGPLRPALVLVRRK